jgi:serine/threonine protein kinase
MLRGEWAHGDIKPENIVLTPEGDLRLIDYDSAWLPGFTQSDMEEAGTPSFSHPLREARRFDKSIDDFSIALMVTMLAALSYDRGTFAPHIDADCALFSPHAVVSGVDRLLNAALALFERKGDKKHRDIAATLYNCSGPIPTLQRLLEG